jgi:flagellar M-ring protein FliF
LAGGGVVGPDGRVEPTLLGDSAEEQALLEDLNLKRGRSPQKRLEQMVDLDEAQAAAILKQWIRHGEHA